MKSARLVPLSRIMLLKIDRLVSDTCISWGVGQSHCFLRAYVKSAISCGVWGRTETLSCLSGVETVAVGFSSADL